MYDRDDIMEFLGPGQVSRVDATSGVFAYPKLQYESDAEEDDNLPIAHEENRQAEIHGAVHYLEPLEPFQSLETINPQFDLSADKVRSIMALSNEENVLLKDEVVDLPEKLSNVECFQYLVKKGPALLEGSPKNRQQTSRILRKMADEIQVLLPGNDAAGLGDCRDISQRQTQLSALASELMMVEDQCSSVVRDAGVFVLSRFQYSELLKLMAQEIEMQASVA